MSEQRPIVCKSCGYRGLSHLDRFSYPCGEPICERCSLILPHLGKLIVRYIFGRSLYA